TPIGTVTFKDGGTSIGTGTLSVGVATLTTAALSVGSHTITTDYAGDGNFNSSSGTLPAQTVNMDASTTVVTSAANPSVFGQSITLTATVTANAPGSGTPSGTVQFTIDGSNFVSPVSLSGGSATSGSISSLTVGPHTITAVYSGDGNFDLSTSADFT